MACSTHLDEHGRLRMVDVSEKAETSRTATAEARVSLSHEAAAAVREGRLPKGDLSPVVRIAAISGAKRAYELVPLCHNVRIDLVEADLAFDGDSAVIRVNVRGRDRTGFEIEAMAGALIGALALYDMVKGIDRSARVEDARLLSKSGGRSGRFEAG